MLYAINCLSTYAISSIQALAIVPFTHINIILAMLHIYSIFRTYIFVLYLQI